MEGGLHKWQVGQKQLEGQHDPDYQPGFASDRLDLADAITVGPDTKEVEQLADDNDVNHHRCRVHDAAPVARKPIVGNEGKDCHQGGNVAHLD